METLKAISLRKSVRSFQEKQVPEEILDEIIKAGFQAPVTLNHYETVHLTIIQNKGIIKRIADEASAWMHKVTKYPQDIDLGTGTLIMVSSEKGLLRCEKYANAACILENMLIATTDLGVDSIMWSAAVTAISDEWSFWKELGIPWLFEPVLAAYFGYAIYDRDPREHKISVNRIY